MTSGFSERFRLPGGYTAEFQFDTISNQLHVEWSPRLPERRTKQLIRKYRQARDIFLIHVARKIGGGIAVIDLPGVEHGGEAANDPTD